MKRIAERPWTMGAFFLLLTMLLCGYQLTAQNPEPAGWYAGDMHVHRSCGGSPVSISTIYQKMSGHNLATLSLLADMGNGEVQDPATDLPRVNGLDDPVSTLGRIVHWDAEWHWDATYSQYPHQALGGHLLALGLTEAHQIWQEYTFPILSWAHQQNAIAGFAHMQYLDAGFPQSLTCCTPVEYPVEVALGAADFVSEDVDGNDYAIQAYYRLLNSGFRPAFVAGTDYPCNDGVTVGSPLTYVRTAGGEMTYRNWVDGISNGRTVVSRNGHNEFLDLKVDGSAGPGDEIYLTGGGTVAVTVQWTATQNLTGTIELVLNGVVVASKDASVTSGSAASLSAAVSFAKSGWLAARRMGSNGHEVHTAAVFVTVDNAPVRANATDPQFYVQWTDNLLTKTAPGGEWNRYFPTSLSAAQARYQTAKALYQQIAQEAQGTAPTLSSITVTPDNQTISPGTTQQFTATGIYSNGSSLNITAQVRWASSNSSIANINLRGLAAAVNGGSAVISATLSGVTGSASVTVQTPSLVSIAVAPSSPTILVGSTQQFAATGTYTDNSTQNITGQVTWTSSNAAVASIATSGLATTLTPGTSEVSATLGSISGSATLTVQAAPLTITTTALPNGAQNQSYSTTLTAEGGAPPYTWSVAAGSALPPGINLSVAGQLSGVPTVAGTSSFTIQVRDSAGTQVSKSLSLTVAAAPSFYTIWSPATVPGTVDSGPDSAVEMGVKFKADRDGSIAGIRFYKSTANTGTHVANLWTSTGTKLASATFSGETASGWQQVNFQTPVVITANTIYVASYHTNAGHYSDDLNYFANKGVDSPPLHALQDGVNGGNGVYAYGTSSIFPSQVYYASNYWVDVAFVPAGPDTTPPTVSAVAPSSGASGVDINASVTATFSEAVDPATITESTFLLFDSSNAAVPATVTYNSGTSTATLAPTSALLNSANYTAVLKGGASDPHVKDAAGNALASDFTWSFTTAAPPPPPPNEGPGGPILIVSSSSNPFSRYYSEILRAEGLNEFTAMDISLVSSTTLATYDIVILGDIPLSASQVAMFTDWVNAGGNLIAMRPDKRLAGLLGLVDTSTTLSNAYLVLNTTSGPGVGLVGQSIQFHGSADQYALNGAASLATLYSSAATATTSPAVSLNQAGLGQAAAFTYDLARSVVYTRQGNPAWSGQARDGQSGPIRPDDLFYGQASFDFQPDWIDLNKVAIPQADEQQRLLANLILQMNQTKRPLPRFWYFPNGYKAVVVMTGDDHGALYGGSGATAARFNDFIASSPAGCSVADWKCVRATAYIVAPSIAANALTNTQAQSYIAQGFEVGVHADSVPSCTDWTPSELDSFYTSQISSFTKQYTSVPAPKTHRMHCISWSDYDTQPKLELQHGIRLDTNYYYWPPEWVNDVPGMFTGSGMPMRFADRNGTLIDVYQATTQMTDESGQSYPENIDTLLDNALGTTGYYGAFTANMHNDGEYSPGADAIVASAQSRGVPIISARQLLTWLDARNGSSLGSLAWNAGTLTFTVAVGAGANGLQVMLPANSASGRLASITFNGNAVPYTTQTIKGVLYGILSGGAGTYEARYSGSSVVTVTSLAFNPSSVTAGASSTATVALSGPAPAGGASITLTSSNTTVATVPPSVTVDAGATSTTFTINTIAVTVPTTVTITASYGESSVSSPLTVTPPAVLSSLGLSPATVVGSNLSTGTVMLTQVAPTGGAVVLLSSADPGVASVPPNVTVTAGSTSANFTITTSPVSTSTEVVITASYETSQSTTLTVNPPALSGLSLSPSSLIGGDSSTATVRLNGPAPPAGASVALTTTNTALAPVPLSVTVPAGATSATFTITTTPVTTTTTVTITGSYTGSSASAPLTLTPAAVLSSLALSPATVVGSKTSTATVTLTQAASAGGALVVLSSADSTVAAVPPNVTITAGSTSAAFTITTFPVSASTRVVITASYGASRTATLTVNPPGLSTLALSPSAVAGGNSSTGTVTLTGTAPAGGIVVSVSSSNTTAATVPQNVTIPAGSASAAFSITTYPVAVSTTSTISAIYGTVTRTATLTVRAAALSSLTLNPSSVKGGTPATATVTLTGPAPLAGIVVNLRSGNANATVPPSVTVNAGGTTANFTINTRTVTTTRSATISATYGSVRRSATLTITP